MVGCNGLFGVSILWVGLAKMIGRTGISPSFGQ